MFLVNVDFNFAVTKLCHPAPFISACCLSVVYSFSLYIVLSFLVGCESLFKSMPDKNCLKLICGSLLNFSQRDLLCMHLQVIIYFSCLGVFFLIEPTSVFPFYLDTVGICQQSVWMVFTIHLGLDAFSNLYLRNRLLYGSK